MARNSEDISELVRNGICPNCKSKLIHSEGCVECEVCGWSACEEA